MKVTRWRCVTRDWGVREVHLPVTWGQCRGLCCVIAFSWCSSCRALSPTDPRPVSPSLSAWHRRRASCRTASLASTITTSCPQYHSLSQSGRLTSRSSPLSYTATWRWQVTTQSECSSSSPGGRCRSSLKHDTSQLYTNLSIHTYANPRDICHTLWQCQQTVVLTPLTAPGPGVCRSRGQSSSPSRCRTATASWIRAYKQVLCHITCHTQGDVHTPQQVTLTLRQLFVVTRFLLYLESSLWKLCHILESICYFKLVIF